MYSSLIDVVNADHIASNDHQIVNWKGSRRKQSLPHIDIKEKPYKQKAPVPYNWPGRSGDMKEVLKAEFLVT